jgi:uncharacterized protein (TIGR00251 family)
MVSGNLAVKVYPGAGCNRIAGYNQGVLQIKIKAPPVEGKANTELIKYLSSRLKVPKSDISIVRGLTSQTKLVHVENLVPEEALKRLGIGL